MFYYEIAVLGLNLKPLTYFSKTKLEIYSLVLVSVSNKQRDGVVLKEVGKPKFDTLEVIEILEIKFSPIQIELAKFMSYYYICSLSMAFNTLIPYKNSNFIDFKFDKTPNLSTIQNEAFEFANSNKTSLIFGDTGSGKSEIYIKLIANTLNLGKQALFLMPEISLTPQMEKRLNDYFGKSIGIWHSKITPAKKKKLINEFENGDIKLIAGARSALFLPFTNLGLIIIDEEHDDSYKSNQKPRYNARDLALFLGNKFDIKVVLGSATPSLTTLQKQPTFRLKGTYFKTQKEIIYDENETSISSKIINELKICLANKNQAIIFLPTRANFKFLQCKNCKSIVKCPFCSVGMSFHKNKNSLVCHYCGYSEYYQTKCKSCADKVFEPKRMGTTEVCDKLATIFKEAKISKFDKDEITTQKKIRKNLKRV